jgi:uncharacterized membrane protein required for colicin V production
MITLNVLFWIFVILFAFIGMSRGWAKEMLVSFAVILGIFIISVLESFVPFIRDVLAEDAGGPMLWVRLFILISLVFFGYQGPNLPRLAASNRFARDKLQDSLLGLFLGALNGYLIFGSIWYYLHIGDYPFPNIISAPPANAAGEAARRLIEILPPLWLQSPVIYFAVAIAFAFVLVVFI